MSDKPYEFVTKEEIDRLEVDLNDATWFEDAKLVQRLLKERDVYRDIAGLLDVEHVFANYELIEVSELIELRKLKPTPSNGGRE